MKKALVLSVLAAVFSFGTAMLPFYTYDTVQSISVAEAAGEQEIQAVGMGSLPVGMPLPRAKMMARRAAIVDAQRQLVEQIKGAAVDAETTVENYLTISDIVKTKVSGMITGAKIVSEGMDFDGGYTVTMSVPSYGVGSVAEVAITQKLQNEGITTPQPIPAPSANAAQAYTPALQANFAGGYTGLVIDARGSQLVRTFCPAIFDTNGRAIYGVQNVDPTFAINKGMVDYAEGTDRWNAIGVGTTRAGGNPLYVKIVSLKERCVNKCDVIISVEDADKILIENQRSGMLNRYAVVFAK